MLFFLHGVNLIIKVAMPLQQRPSTERTCPSPSLAVAAVVHLIAESTLMSPHCLGFIDLIWGLYSISEAIGVTMDQGLRSPGVVILRTTTTNH